MSNTDFSKRFKWLKEYGGFCLAYSTLVNRPGLLTYFDDDEADGYIAYAEKYHRKYVLANPVVHPDRLPLLLDHFLTFCRQNGCRAVFSQTRSETAKLLHDRGFSVNEMGVETRVDLKSFDLKGKQKSHLRRWRNAARNAGVVVSECSFDQIDLDALRALSQEWVKAKGGKEDTFLVPPLHYEDREDVRAFFGFIGDKLTGIVTFEPMYRGGKVFGYAQQHMREINAAPNGNLDYITLMAIEQFQKENIELIDLGMSPFYDVCANGFRHSRFLRGFFNFTYNTKLGNWFYSFQGNHFHKEKYRGIEDKIYYATQDFSLLDIVGLGRVVELI